MTLLVCFALAWLFVAPDKGTLALKGGVAGVLRSVFGSGRSTLSRKTGRPAGRHGTTSRRGATPRSILAGWREGVTSARQAREEGRDLWSRGSRIGGRIAGGTRSVVVAVRSTVHKRRRPAATETVIHDPDVVAEQDQRPLFSSVSDSSPLPTETGRGQMTCTRCGAGDADEDDRLCMPCRLASWDAVEKIEAGWKELGVDQRQAPCWRCGRAGVRGPDGVCATCEFEVFGLRYFNLSSLADGQHSPGPQPADPADDPPAAHGAGGLDADRYFIWSIPGGSSYWVLDRSDVDEPRGPYISETEATATAEYVSDAHAANGRGSVLHLEQHEFTVHDDSVPNAASALEPTQIPVAQMTTGRFSNISRKEIRMPIAGSELANIDDVAGEVTAATNAVEELGVALGELKAWADALTDRWGGTTWSTDGLDMAIAGVGETAAELKMPDGVLEQLASITAEIQKARAVGEAAEAARAKGDLSGFVAQ